jgi:hypothetical protein
MSFARIALLPLKVRAECHELVRNLDRVREFVQKFVSMGFCDASPDSSRAKTGQSDLPFVCSDMISFLFRVEKLCPSREAALYVLQKSIPAAITILTDLLGLSDSRKSGALAKQRTVR